MDADHRPSNEDLSPPRVRPDPGGTRRVELILVGRDLLRGCVGDSNAVVIADRIARRGDRVERITVVDDAESAISEALREALSRGAQLVVLTGGTGPAGDDRTLESVASVLRTPLQANQEARSMVEQAYQRLYRARIVNTAGMNLVREKLVRIPLGSQPIENPIGVAPGVLCRLAAGARVLCLPGHPDEMRDVLERALTLLREPGPRNELARREIEAPTADESSLKPLLDRVAAEYPAVWVTSRPVGSGRKGSRVIVILEAAAPTRQEANALIGVAMRRLLGLAGGNR